MQLVIKTKADNYVPLRNTLFKKSVQPKSRRDDHVRGDELADLTALAGLLTLVSCVPLPERQMPGTALVLDGSQIADKLSSTLVESKLLSTGEVTKADNFSEAATVMFAGEAAAFPIFSETTDSKVSCRQRFRAGDNGAGDVR